MGSYSSLNIAGYEVDWSKSYINPFWGRLFTEKDKRSRNVPYEEYYNKPINETNLAPTFEYAASVNTMKLRMEILGYTLPKSIEVFSTGIKNLITDRTAYNFDDDHVLKHLKSLDQGGFYFWLELVRKVIYNEEDAIKEELVTPDQEIFSFLIGDGEIVDTLPGFPNVSLGYIIRGLLEAVDEDEEVLLEMTALVSGGYYSEDEPVCENAVQGTINSTLEFQKIIILTEGHSDTKILSRSLDLLYPHVAEYFSFMDFGAAKPEGGSSALERTIKSFAAAGINNKLIALFDNDAAGLAAQKRLSKLKWPDNIKILTLPNLPIGEKYPTMGAQGTTLENINGRACSIEMYLGEDVLMQGGNFIPVRWRNLEDQINEYQGEVFQKGDIQDRFFEKLGLSPVGNPKGDWTGIKLIFEHLFKVVGTIS